MPTDDQLEKLLRKAPAPAAPFGLEQRLIERASKPVLEKRRTPSWFVLFEGRNWAPALALFLVMAGLLTAVAFQQSALNELKQAQLEATAEAAKDAPQHQGRGESQFDRELQQLQKQSTELQALRAEIAETERLLAHQPQLAAENAALRAELSSLTKNNPELSPEFQNALSEARKKADRIRCVNNLKNVGLGARIWATDNGDHLPKDFVTMRNELSTPKILICPSDPVRAGRVNTWEEFATLGGSYEMLSAGISEQFPGAVYARCPFHNNVALADGSVHQLKPEQQLVERYDPLGKYWEIKK